MDQRMAEAQESTMTANDQQPNSITLVVPEEAMVKKSHQRSFLTCSLAEEDLEDVSRQPSFFLLFTVLQRDLIALT
jgi:hypothetical protein